MIPHSGEYPVWSGCWLLQLQAAHLGVAHLLNLVHRFVVENALDGLVDDAMADGEHRLVGVLGANPFQKLSCARRQVGQRFDVGRPFLDALQVGDVLSRERTPVALAQQGGLDHGLAVRLGDDLAGLDGAVEVAGHESVDGFSGQLVADGLGLSDARGVELSLRLSLHDFGGVVYGLAVTDQKECCHCPKVDFSGAKVGKNAGRCRHAGGFSYFCLGFLIMQ